MELVNTKFPKPCQKHAGVAFRYGMKAEAISLLQEWVQAIGSKAGLNSQNTALLSGAVGVPESRLEVTCCCVAPTPVWQPVPKHITKQ